MLQAKRFMVFMLISTLVFLNTSSVVTASTEDDLVTITTPIDYTSLVNSDDWQKMSVEEHISSCIVSDSVSRRMTTEALVETVVTCPLTSMIYVYTTVSEGIRKASQVLPQLEELLSRSDALSFLQAYINSSGNSISAENTDTAAYYVALRLKEYLQELHETDVFVDPLTGWNAIYVKTPHNSNVMAYIGLTFADHGVTAAEATSNTTSMASVFSATVLASASPLYNCHAYAWYSTSCSYWINDPHQYMTDGSYSQINTPVAGCKVTYKIAGNTLDHSGIVSSTGTTVYVTSKWGCLGLMRHTLYNNPYYLLDYANNIQYWN